MRKARKTGFIEIVFRYRASIAAGSAILDVEPAAADSQIF